MYIEACRDRLSSQLVEILSQETSLSVSEIEKRLFERYGSMAASATLYRRIAKLLENQVVVAHRRRFSLNLVWVSQILRLAQGLQRTYGFPACEVVQLPRREGTSRTYTASSLRQLDPLWNSLMLEIGTRSGEKAWYGYNSHPWFALGMHGFEEALFRSLFGAGVKTYLLYGNDTWLDHYGVEQVRMEGLHQKIGLCEALPREGYAAWATTNYLIECQFPPKVAAQFADFFLHTRRIADFNRKAFEHTFAQKAACRLKVHKSRKRAAHVRELLRSYFS